MDISATQNSVHKDGWQVIIIMTLRGDMYESAGFTSVLL